jgi:hypothetical protein
MSVISTEALLGWSLEEVLELFARQGRTTGTWEEHAQTMCAIYERVIKEDKDGDIFYARDKKFAVLVNRGFFEAHCRWAEQDPTHFFPLGWIYQNY